MAGGHTLISGSSDSVGDVVSLVGLAGDGKPHFLGIEIGDSLSNGFDHGGVVIGGVQAKLDCSFSVESIEVHGIVYSGQQSGEVLVHLVDGTLEGASSLFGVYIEAERFSGDLCLKIDLVLKLVTGLIEELSSVETVIEETVLPNKFVSVLKSG